MADIKITELRPAGSELFQIDESESFLDELDEQEMSITLGGGTNVVVSIDNKGGSISTGGGSISISTPK